jgi:hypothetical protein
MTAFNTNSVRCPSEGHATAQAAGSPQQPLPVTVSAMRPAVTNREDRAERRPQLSVYLEDNGRLSYRAWTKGARWRTGFKSLDDVCRDADRQTGVEAYAINYVMRRA